MEILNYILRAFEPIIFVFLIFGLISPKISLFWIKNKEKRTRTTSFAIYFLALILLELAISSTTPNKKENQQSAETKTEITKNVTTEKPSLNAEKKKVHAPKYWEYSQDFNEMDETTIYTATCASTNINEFEFPYNGGSVLYLVIRNMNGKNDVYLHISKGQIVSSFDGSEYVRFKFDEEKPESFNYGSASDGSSEYAFINGSNKLINKIKKAKHIKVDLPIFQEARPVFEFNVEGLKWEH